MDRASLYGLPDAKEGMSSNGHALKMLFFSYENGSSENKRKEVITWKDINEKSP